MKETIETYKRAGKDYKEGPLRPPEQAWMQRALRGQPRSSTVLEFGSGLGARSRYIESLGYRVQRSDVAGSFLEYLAGSNPEPILLDLLRDPVPPSRIFYASAVLLHFRKEEVPGVLQKIYGATQGGGVFFFSLKEGEGEEMKPGPWGSRFFAYWSEGEIVSALLHAGWEEIEIERDTSAEGETMMQIIARKTSS